MAFQQQGDSFGQNCQQSAQDVAGFVSKTFEILNENDFMKIIYWSSNGTQFTIKDVIKFEQIVLPKYFRHNKMNSFVRQLNMYGFHKTKHNNFKSTFKHPYFQKGKQEQLYLVRRKLKNNQQNEPPRLQQIRPAVAIPKPTSIIEKQPAENTSTSLEKYFNFSNEFIGTTKMINFSLRKVSFNDFNNALGNLQEEPQQEDCVSIQDAIEANERQQEMDLGLGDTGNIFNFQNPSCFFSSRFNI